MHPFGLFRGRAVHLCVAILAWLMVAPATGAAAGPGAAAFAAGDYKRALSILEPQARRGQA